MKTIITISIILFCSLRSFGQYSQGDINVWFFSTLVFHNDEECFSMVDTQISIQVNNSYVDDTVKLIDYAGNVFQQFVNTSGESLWNVPYNPTYMSQESDFYLFNSYVSMGVPHNIHKIVVEYDTLYLNGTSPIQVYVPNPCDYNSVSGRIYIDNDNDCTFSSGDEGVNGFVPYVAANYTYQPYIQSGSSGNTNGVYNVTFQESWLTDYTVSIPSVYQFVFPASPCFQTSYTFTSLPQTNVDFPLQCADLDTRVSASWNPARPAIPFHLLPRVWNIGCTPVSGTLKLILDPNVIYNPANSTNPANAVSGDTLIWNYANLNNLAGGAYFNHLLGGIELTPTTAVNIGDFLFFELMTEVHQNDVNPSNNTYSFLIPIVNSYDPNIKEVDPKGIGQEGFIPTTTEKLTYTIHFQNTGTAEAINIKVIDTLEANLLPNTLKILEVSHNMIPEWLNPNTIQFRFPNINLPDSNTNEPLSHGFVRFEIDMVQGLSPGTEIKNKVEIYFDTNEPIVTNYAVNTIEFPVDDLSVNNLASLDVKVYPNPANDIVNFEIKEQSGIDLTIRDITGKLTYHSSHENVSVIQVDTKNIARGVYLYELKDNNLNLTKTGKLMLR